MNKIFFTFLFLCISTIAGNVYYVSPNGNNYNDGKTPLTAWKSIDRGQPTYLRKDTKEGDDIIYVAKATQFPEKGKVKIGNVEVQYSGRTGDSLTGCIGTPAAKKNTPVISLDWDYPKPGDKIVVMEGVYILREKFSPDNGEWAGGVNSVFAITSSGNEDAPITIEGQGKSIIDGEFSKKSIFIKANNIKIKNLHIRRGGIFIVFSKNVEIDGNRIYYGINSIFVRYSEKVNIVRNLIYDFHGAWTDPGIQVGDSKNVNILNNTIVNNGTGINIWGNTKELSIKNNLVAWCGTGIVIGEKVEIKQEDIKDNLLWANGSVTWLHNLAKPDTSEGQRHYKGLSFKSADIYQDPNIVSWYSNSEKFLSPHKDSVCFREGRNIGAREPSKYEKTINYKMGKNILYNGSFEFGFYGWRATSWWSFNEGEAVWEIREGSASHGKKCLYLRESPSPGSGRRSAPMITSAYFPVNRGTPYTISFSAKGKGNLYVGFAVPSWHDGSGFNRGFQLTDEWKRYSFTIRLPDYVPDWVAVRFSSSWSEAYIDKVTVVEGEKGSNEYDEIEIFYKNTEYGMLPPNGTLPLLINNYGDKKDFLVVWEIISPFGKVIDKGSFNPEEKKEIDMKIKAEEGIYIFKYEILNKEGNVFSDGFFRFAIGQPIRDIKNRDFIAATPPYKHYSSLNDFEDMVKKLSAYGIGIFHIYTEIDRMKELIEEEYFDRYLSITKKYGINWLVTLDDPGLFTGKRTSASAPGNVKNVFPDLEKKKLDTGRLTKEQLEVWEAYISGILKKFKGRIKYYEIANEPNCGYSPEEYIRIFEETVPIIREMDEKAVIIGGSVVNAFRNPFYNKILQQIPSGAFDFFSFHPYRFGIMNPEVQGSIREHIRMVQEDLKNYRHKEKIWLTEEGMGPGHERTRGIGSFFSYSIALYSNYFTEDELLWTQFAIRMYLTAFGEGVGGYNYHTLPVLIVDKESTPSLLLKALHAMAGILGNATLEGFLEINEKYVVYIFSEKGKKIAVMWDKDSEWAPTSKIIMPYPGDIVIYDMFGGNKGFEKRDGSLIWEFDRYINYIVFPEMPTEKIKEILNRTFSGLMNIPVF